MKFNVLGLFLLLSAAVLAPALPAHAAAKTGADDGIPVLENRILPSERESEQKKEAAEETETPAYQKLYPDLYVTPIAEHDPVDSKVIYLTFDDGPFAMTDSYLELLGKHGVTATFFVIGRNDAASRARMKRIASAGHTLAPHSYTHDYGKIYASVDDFLHDFKKISDLVYSITGQKPAVFRFPGGSVNIYNKKVCRLIIDEMLRRGYTYYDWSISAADTAKNATAATTEENVLRKLDKTAHKIVLMHEGKKHTLSALDSLIETLKKGGYTFAGITAKTKPVRLPLPAK